MKDTNHTSSLYAIKKRWKKRLSKSLVTLSGKESVWSNSALKSRGVVRIKSNIYDGAFSQKWWTTFF